MSSPLAAEGAVSLLPEARSIQVGRDVFVRTFDPIVTSDLAKIGIPIAPSDLSTTTAFTALFTVKNRKNRKNRTPVTGPTVTRCLIDEATTSISLTQIAVSNHVKAAA